ncbi:zinc finger and BTB domain-containing protein 11 isoform X1 [Delphinapterus leucas]|uniref:Zinc finger and BTB domain-containing protein 11 n=1 Tax=Delphinapterus leucas TaxID=9749 RepID=A0A2Y9PSC4_DELLE|nr:zinc finger and BTB domain-containing protein 11 isoform X1 [Delphinapterus leucas]
MSSEESYQAILRYLTNECEPYAPGTEGNVKRKIRKAAACYVVRDGTLYYQRRQRHRKTFAELEVVLQPDRRRGLIEAAHLGPGGTHHTQHQTWHDLSKTYWWRGILKQVKDYIKQCSKCQEKLDRSRPISDTSEMLEELGLDLESGEESNESEDDLSNFTSPPTTASKPAKKKPVSKHELVFYIGTGRQNTFLEAVSGSCSKVDTKGVVKRSSPKHCQAVLRQLNEQRLSNQFCDVTLLIEGEEYKAHKSVLSANSEYFRDLFIEKGAVSSHEAVVDLSGFCKASFLPLLEFAYTSVLSFDFCSMADVAILARHLFMSEVLEICESVHKLMEEKQLTVYKKGEVQTVTSTQDLPEQNGGTAPPVANNEGTTTTLSTELGDCEIVLLVNGELPEQNGELGQQPEPQVSSQTEAALSPVGCVTDSHPEMESVDLVTKNSQTELETLNSREDGTVSDTHPKLSKENVISSSPENSNMGNDTATEDICAEDISEHRQNLGQSLKDQENLVEPTAQTDHSPDDDDTYRSRLRQRSVNEGGYIRLHKGMEKKLQKRKAISKSAVQQVAQKLVQRGKKMKQPKRDAKENTEEEASHKCGECGMVFQRRYALIKHILKHERARDYKCPLCKKQFQYSASLRAHLIRHTRKDAPTSSSSSSAPNEASGSSSEKGRTKREFICSICGRTLPKLYSLRIHMLKHTGVKPHACQVCGKTFIYKHGLKLHQSLHQSQKQFQCELCVKSFVTKRSLQEHMSIHTGESKYLCSVCGKSFHRGSGLSKHLKKHQPKPEVRGYHCTQCEKSFFEARDLRQHMNKHLGVKPFQCQFCDKCYSWKKDWYSHVKSHSVTEPYRCNICGKEFYEKALFRRHVKKATHGKKGRAKQNLERVCEQCGRKFTQLREYRRHMNNHGGVKPFECLTCGVAWADARSLKRHVRTHTGERPYVCPVCSEAYIDARTLRKHMTKFHRDYVPCKIMLEKDTLQFHNQGTQVEHAVSILTADMQEQENSGPQELETVVVTGETMEALEAVAATEECPSVSTLSDQSIMQVVNYVLAQQQGQKLSEVAEAIQTVEVEVAHISETE